jgi:hypothetical protein
MSSIGSVSGDPMVGLAVLMLENAERLGELDRQRLNDARQAMDQASAAEIEALHDAADAVARGALVQGGLTFIGGAISFGAACNGAGATRGFPGGRTEAVNPKADLTLRIGDSVGSLAQPMAALAGNVPSRHAEAEAAKARHESENARFDADEAESDARADERQADVVLDHLGQILDTETQGNLAILGNF